jgi:hypothetical protein
VRIARDWPYVAVGFVLILALATSCSPTTATLRAPSPTSSVVPVTVALPTISTTSVPVKGVLQVSSTELTVGTGVTISGTECPPGHWGTASLVPNPYPAIFQPANGGLYPSEDSFNDAAGDAYPGGTADATGRWTMSVTVPMVPSGAAIVMGSCRPQVDGDGASIEFTYPDISVTVTSPFRVEVEPSTTVAPGSTLQVYLAGGVCPGASSPETYLYDTDQVQVVQATPFYSTGQEYRLTVPSELTPGLYSLEADCVYSRGVVQGSYTPIPITVT